MFTQGEYSFKDSSPNKKQIKSIGSCNSLPDFKLSCEEPNSAISSRVSSYDDLQSMGRYSPSKNSPGKPLKYKELTRNDIERITTFRPLNITHYQQAFVHKSVQKHIRYQKDAPDYLKQSYERYEYLGDSVLNLVVANYLFKKYPDSEGLLTRLRTKLVNGKTLSMFAKKLGFNEFLVISTNVENIDGRNNDRILEDVFEAFICAIHLDRGFKHAEDFIIRIITSYINFSELEKDNNYKDILLRFCQNKMGVVPCYETIGVEGPPHKRNFTVIVTIQDEKYKMGMGKCKKSAEQNASMETLKYFKYFED
jgi:ribonuclease III